jgi:hypothetical protein
MYHGVGLYQDLVIPVTNFHNEDKGLMVLAGDVFDVPIRKDIIHRVVRWQLAKRQQVVIDYYFRFLVPEACCCNDSSSINIKLYISLNKKNKTMINTNILTICLHYILELLQIWIPIAILIL